jgi:hypothetical protein
MFSLQFALALNLISGAMWIRLRALQVLAQVMMNYWNAARSFTFFARDCTFLCGDKTS